jgi:hypothetical protein
MGRWKDDEGKWKIGYVECKSNVEMSGAYGSRCSVDLMYYLFWQSSFCASDGDGLYQGCQNAGLGLS